MRCETKDFILGVAGAVVLASVMCLGFYLREIADKETSKESVKHEGLKPLEQLMPQFQIITNSPTDFQVAFKAYNATNWSVDTNHLKSELDAALVIAEVHMTLEIKYEIGKAICDSLEGKEVK